MSGHLLQTMNPEAVEGPEDMPELGTWVLFIARPGMGQGGRSIFGAHVMHVDKRKGTCSLEVHFGRDDTRMYDHVRRRTDQEPMHCWDFTPDWYAITDCQDRTDALADGFKKLEGAIFGDFNRPVKEDGSPKSIIDILAEFEQRVFAAEKAAKPAK